jgi:glutamine amidotransferase
MNIVVIDLGISNLSSLCNCLNFLGAKFQISNNKNTLDKASHIILPGVGSFDEFIKAITKADLIESLKHKVLIKNVPILGICIGFQVLLKKSEEGKAKGLGFINGEVKKLSLSKKKYFKVPNVGFAQLSNFKKNNLFKNLEKSDAFYFMHSYACYKIYDNLVSCAYSEHNTNFIAAFQKKNICGFQFHPEKSQTSGLKLLKNFLEIK